MDLLTIAVMPVYFGPELVVWCVGEFHSVDIRTELSFVLAFRRYLDLLVEKTEFKKTVYLSVDSRQRETTG